MTAETVFYLLAGFAVVSALLCITQRNPIASALLTLPSGAKISAVQAYVQQGQSGSWRWTGNFQPIANLRMGAGNSLSVRVPSDAQPLRELGVQVSTNGTYTGTIFVDNVTYK